MHLYIATKGIKHDVDRFISELSAKYLSMKGTLEEGGKVQDIQCQLSVRPIQLWEIGYPKEWNDVLCNTLLGGTMGEVVGNDGIKPVKHTWTNKFIYIFRKFFHLAPIQPYDKTRALALYKDNIMIVGLGTKQDYIMPNGVEGI